MDDDFNWIGAVVIIAILFWLALCVVVMMSGPSLIK